MSEAFFQELCDRASDLIQCVSPDGLFAYVNRSWLTTLGYSQEEAHRLTLWDIIAPSQQDRWIDIVGRVLAGERVDNLQTLLRTKAGEQIWVEGNLICHTSERHTQLIQAIFRNIDERMRKEHLLYEREDRYRTVIAALESGVVLQYADGVIHASNASAERILGLTTEQMMGRTSIDPHWRALREDGTPFPGEAHPAMVSLRTGTPCSDVVMGVHKPDDSLVWISVSSQPLFHEHETHPYAVVASFVDITKRKQLEEELRDREAQYRLLFEHSLDGVLLTAPDGRIFAANPAACQIFGFTEAEICQRGRAELVDTTDPQFARVLEERSRTGQFKGELTHRRADGSLFPGEISTAVFTDRHGNARTSMIIRNISERKQAEQALRESEERFARIFRASPVGISITTLAEGRVIDMNESCLKLLGYTRNEMIGRSAVELGIWRNSDDRPKVVQILKQHGYYRNWGTQFVTKSGQIRDALLSLERIELQGEPCMLTLVYDITDWKQAERDKEQLISELQEALANIKTLRGLIPICASCKNIRDDDGYWNKLESYLQAHTDADFSHGICPECMQRLYSEFYDI